MATFVRPEQETRRDEAAGSRMSARKIARARELDRAESYKAFDELARQYLNIDGAEFLARWHKGEFAARAEDRDVRRVEMMIPGIYRLQ